MNWSIPPCVGIHGAGFIGLALGRKLELVLLGQPSAALPAWFISVVPYLPAILVMAAFVLMRKSKSPRSRLGILLISIGLCTAGCVWASWWIDPSYGCWMGLIIGAILAFFLAIQLRDPWYPSRKEAGLASTSQAPAAFHAMIVAQHFDAGRVAIRLTPDS